MKAVVNRLYTCKNARDKWMFACSELLYALNFFFMTAYNKYIPCLPGPQNHDMQDKCFGNVSDKSKTFTS